MERARRAGSRTVLRAGVGALALLSVGGSAGCLGSAQSRYEEQLASAPREARHAVQSQRLAELMGGLERLAVQRLPRAMDLRATEEARTAEVAEVARAMVESAGSIAEAAGSVGLVGAEREAFVALAAELRRRSQRLADESPHLTLEELRQQTRAIQDTCAGCHQRFGIPRGADAD